MKHGSKFLQQKHEARPSTTQGSAYATSPKPSPPAPLLFAPLALSVCRSTSKMQLLQSVACYAGCLYQLSCRSFRNPDAQATIRTDLQFEPDRRQGCITAYFWYVTTRQIGVALRSSCSNEGFWNQRSSLWTPEKATTSFQHYRGTEYLYLALVPQGRVSEFLLVMHCERERDFVYINRRMGAKFCFSKSNQ